MALPAPRVLQRLRALGLTQTAMAAHLGVTQAAISLWLTGKRPFDEPWQTDAERLLAVVGEHLAQDKPLDTVRFRPAHFMNVSGTTYTGEGAPLTEEDSAALTALQQELAAQAPDRFVSGVSIWHAHHTAAHITNRLAAIDPRTADLSAEDLNDLYRMAQALVLHFASHVHIKARKALGGGENADQTP